MIVLFACKVTIFSATSCRKGMEIGENVMLSSNFLPADAINRN
jgi:hypothetical protein